MNKKTKKSRKIAILAVSIGVFALLSLSYAIASSITAKNIINLVNEARVKQGLKILEENSKLSAAAALKAEDMLKNDYFAHNSPAGKTPWFWMDKIGYSYKYAGENLAMNFTSAEEEQKAWMKSPTHRNNILNTNYQEIGVAVKEGKINGASTIVAVQMFGTRTNFVPAAQKAPEQNLEETKTAVLGEEEKAPVPLPLPDQEFLTEDLLNNNNFVPEEVVRQADSSSVPVSLWQKIKGQFSGENRSEWLTISALYMLWAILLANVIFVAYSIYHKAVLAGKKEENNLEEIKIPVKNLENKGKSGQDQVFPIRVNILGIPHLEPKA